MSRTCANLGNFPQPEYLDAEVNPRLYEPNLVARSTRGTHWPLETKGCEDPDVARKDARAERRCADATVPAGVEWRYRKVPQEEIERASPRSPSDLLSVLDAGGAPFVWRPRWPRSAAGGPHPTGAAYTSRWRGSGGPRPP